MSTSSNTYKSYATDLRQFFQSLEIFSQKKQKSDFNNKELAALHFALNQWAHLKLSTRNRKHACVKSFLKWLYANKHINDPLDQHVICPKVPKKTPHFLSLDEVIALLAHLEKEVSLANDNEALLKSKRNHSLIMTIYAGALRVSEACQLKWKDLSSKAGHIKVIGKGDKERLVVLPQKVIRSINQLEHVSDYVFSLTHKQLNPRTAYEIIRTAGFKTGLNNPLNPHALRHSLATHLLSDGMNLRTLQKFLGHKSLTATEKYTHLGIDQLASTMNAAHPLAKKDLP